MCALISWHFSSVHPCLDQARHTLDIGHYETQSPPPETCAGHTHNAKHWLQFKCTHDVSANLQGSLWQEVPKRPRCTCLEWMLLQLALFQGGLQPRPITPAYSDASIVNIT